MPDIQYIISAVARDSHAVGAVEIDGLFVVWDRICHPRQGDAVRLFAESARSLGCDLVSDLIVLTDHDYTRILLLQGDGDPEEVLDALVDAALEVYLDLGRDLSVS